MQFDSVAPRVLTKQFDSAGVGTKQNRAAREWSWSYPSIRTEKPVDLAGLDRQVETVERARRSEVLCET